MKIRCAVSLALPVAALGVYAVAVQLAGGSALGLALYGLCFALCLVLPGLFLAEKLVPGLCLAARLATGTVLGCALLMAGFVVFGALGLPVLACLPGAALGLYWLFTKRRVLVGLPGRLCRIGTAGQLLLVLVAGLIAYNALAGVLTAAYPHVYGNYFYLQDMIWSTGNAAAVQWGFPLVDIRSAAGVMHYHYLSDAVAGLLALASGQSAWDSVFYYTWPLWMPLLLCALWALGRELGARPLPALLLPLAAALAHGHIYELYYHFFINPNGVVQSYLYLAVCVLLLLRAEKGGFKAKWLLPAFLCAVLVLVWGKGTTGGLFLLGVAAALVVYSLVHRRVIKGALLYAGGGLALFGLLFWLILSGGMTQVALGDPLAGLRGLWGQARLEWAVLVLYIPCAVYALWRIKTIRLTVLALHATAVGGVLASALFTHYGGSQAYFFYTAVFLMWACVLERLASLPTGKRALRLCATALAGVMALAAMAPQLGVTLSRARGGLGVARHILSGNGEEMFEYTYLTLSARDEEAALWLRDNMGRDELFATNRNNRQELGNDGIFHFYSGMSGRRSYMEGWQYALDYSTAYEDIIYQLEQVSEVMFALDTTYAEAAQIARAHGIRYLVLQLANRYDVPFEGGEPVFANGEVLIYDVGE